MKVTEIITEAASAAQQAAIAISMKKANKKPKNESTELEEEFDLIESIIERLAEHNGVDAEVIWEDLETLTEDELYAFAVTSEPIMESQDVAEAYQFKGSFPFDVDHMSRSRGINLPSAPTKKFFTDKQKWSQTVDDINSSKYDDNSEYTGVTGRSTVSIDGHEWARWSDAQQKGYIELSSMSERGVAEDWQKANKRDRTDGMSQKAVNAYRRENPGSKLKTAVTTKPSKLKKGGKASKRRKSYCSRSRGQMKMHSISCSKTPDKAICKARRRWNC